MGTRENVGTGARELAREAEASPVFEALARAGYVANGILHALVAVIVIVIAAGGAGEGDQAGALKAVAGAPAGFVALWLLAIGLWALALWHLSEGVLAHDRTGDIRGAARTWGRRSAEFGQATVFAALGAVSAAVALGARPDGEETAEDASRSLLAVPGGPVVLGAVGIAIGTGGVAFIVMGVRRSFRERMVLPPGAAGRSVTVLGVVGFLAKGLALLIVGALLVSAALRSDAQAAGGLDGAVDLLLDLPAGPALVWLVGLGLLGYGAFTIARARFARM